MKAAGYILILLSTTNILSLIILDNSEKKLAKNEKIACDQSARIEVLEEHRITHNDTLEIIYWIVGQNVNRKSKKQ